VTTRYDEAYYREEFGVDRIRRFDMHWWAVRYYALVCRRLLRRQRGRTFLDIGCAHGYTLARLENEFDTYGMDVSAYAIGRARDIAPRSWTRVHDITSGFPEELAGVEFDVVLLKHVLEHLPEPGAAIWRVADRLRAGGALLFSVPNTTSPGIRLKGARWFAYLDRTHCSLLAPSAWAALVREAGLVVERTWSDGLWDVPYVRGVPRLLQLPIFSGPTIAEVLVGGTFLPVRWGENLLVCARKPPAS
jgi:2-polyprenyl-3-methyl-5-hydroxy-6-metoxy-1,4-benzoquinol methylase